MPITKAGGFITDHRSPLKERWGGWYVTGTTGDQVHMGNAVMPGATGESMPPVEGSQNVKFPLAGDRTDTSVERGSMFCRERDRLMTDYGT